MRVSPKVPRPNSRDLSYLKEWFNLDEDKCDGFSCDGTIDYRIKQEQKYRPFKSQKECWDEMLKHKPFGWVIQKTEDVYNTIGCVTGCNGFVDILFANNESKIFTAEFLFENYKFSDGKPFGIKEE